MRRPMWAGYSRVSRVGDRAERLISPDLQARRIRAYAASHGLRVEMLQPELDVSGGRVERPVLSEALCGIAEGAYEGIIVAQLDRLSRLGLSDVLKIIERIESGGGKVIAVQENFDAATPEGEMARNVILSLGHMQLRRYSDAFADAKRSAVERGIWPVPRVPLGYKRGPDRKLVPHQPKTIERAFKARAAGKSWSEISRNLPLGPSGAARLVANRVYLGEVRVGEWANQAAHEPLVSRSLWEAAQIAHPVPVRLPCLSLLSGLCRCAGCRRTMTPEKSKGNQIYRCFPNKSGGRCPAPAIVGMGVVEPLVERVVLDHLDHLTVSASENSGALDAAGERLNAAESELAAFQQVSRVSDVGSEFFGAGMRSRVDEVEKARREVAVLRLQRMTPAAPGVEWNDLSLEERNHVLRRTIGCVWVRKGRGSGRIRIIEFGHEPPLPAPGAPVDSLDWEADIEGELRMSSL